MIQKDYHFEYQIFASVKELAEGDRLLMEEAQAATSKAYAPYSNFRVGAAVLLSDGSIVSGANQENASFPAGICAERAVLATISSLHKNVDIIKMAISYFNAEGTSNEPITPCGICRQALAEYTHRSGHAIPLILGGMEGEVWVIPDAELLLPMSFSGKDLKK
jgi:cytidine deaminase